MCDSFIPGNYETEDMRCYVEGVKQSLINIEHKRLSTSKVLVQSIQWLYEHYEESQDVRFLETALLEIRAYMEMGFLYEHHAALFDTILSELGLRREICFPKKIYGAKPVNLTCNSVRRMIGKWQASPRQNMKIGEVVTDIIERVRAGKEGIFRYENGVTGEVYELVIDEAETYFHAFRQEKYYTFVNVEEHSQKIEKESEEDGV